MGMVYLRPPPSLHTPDVIVPADDLDNPNLDAVPGKGEAVALKERVRLARVHEEDIILAIGKEDGSDIVRTDAEIPAAPPGAVALARCSPKSPWPGHTPPPPEVQGPEQHPHLPPLRAVIGGAARDLVNPVQTA